MPLPWRPAVIAAALLASAEASAGEIWRYGEHPVLGLSAHVDVDGQSLGLACAQSSELRVTKGLATRIEPTKGHPFTAAWAYFFEGWPDRGGNLLSPGEGNFLRSEGNACETHVEAFAHGRAFVIVDRTGLKAGDDERRAPVRFRIPLSGSAAAIKQLIKACPAMARDLREACGI